MIATETDIALVWEWKWRGVFSFTNAARFLHCIEGVKAQHNEMET